MKYDVCAIVNRTYYCIFEMLFTLMLNILVGHEDIVTYCRPGNWYISKYVREYLNVKNAFWIHGQPMLPACIVAIDLLSIG